MSLEGEVQDGKIVFSEPIGLPEGTRVRVEPVLKAALAGSSARTLLEQLGDLVGSIDDLPPDLAENHDHYLYGTPKRS